MTKGMWTAVAVLALARPATAAAQMPMMGDAPPVIVTRGSGVIKRAPDQAFVTIAAESRANMPADAQRLAAEAMTGVQKALDKAGLRSDAIKTTGYSLQPDMEYDNGRSRVRGYIARNQIEVRVDDLSKLGAVIDAAGTGGATSMAGLRFDIKERAEIEREALRLAVEDAMARAKALARGAGKDLGDIVRLEEQGSAPPPVLYTAMRMGAESAPETPVNPGEMEIRADVALTVRIK